MTDGKRLQRLIARLRRLEQSWVAQARAVDGEDHYGSAALSRQLRAVASDLRRVIRSADPAPTDDGQQRGTQ